MSRDPEALDDGAVMVPAATAWPMLAGLGVTLLTAGLVTHVLVSLTGAALLAASAVGWFGEVFPTPHEEAVALAAPAPPVAPRARRHPAAGEGGHRARLPLAVHPYRAGVAGGLAGGAVMAALAVGWGAASAGSPWYPVNLLAAAGSAALSTAGEPALHAFSATGLGVAVVVHAALSVLLGLLYAVLLPTLPRAPVLWGGLVAPLLWTGLLRSGLGLLDPALEARVDWPWFTLTQVAFGLVAGGVVRRAGRVPTAQPPPVAAGAGGAG